MSGSFSVGMPRRYWMTPREFMEWLDVYRDDKAWARIVRGGVKPIVRVKAGRSHA